MITDQDAACGEDNGDDDGDDEDDLYMLVMIKLHAFVMFALEFSVNLQITIRFPMKLLGNITMTMMIDH